MIIKKEKKALIVIGGNAKIVTYILQNVKNGVLFEKIFLLTSRPPEFKNGRNKSEEWINVKQGNLLYSR